MTPATEFAVGGSWNEARVVVRLRSESAGVHRGQGAVECQRE